MKNRRGTRFFLGGVLTCRQFSHTSPRTLLAIIRMSQAIARLHFRELVEIADVDEALRLIKAAKASLNDSTGPTNRDMSKATQVYEIIRQMHNSANGQDMAIDEIRRRVTGRGFTEDEMWSTIKEYTDYGVLFTTGDNMRLRFVVDDGMSDMDID
jgi:DNA replication licensing factor MCM7